MKRFVLLGCSAAVAAGVSMAQPLPVKVSPSAEYNNPALIAMDVRSDCGLPEAQALASLKGLQEVGVAAESAPESQLEAAGYYLQLQLENAVSMGNAFVGHRKYVALTARLYKDGKLVDTFTGARDSMGGFFGGFKGSCSVLRRCSNTLGKDVAVWAKGKMAL